MHGTIQMHLHRNQMKKMEKKWNKYIYDEWLGMEIGILTLRSMQIKTN